MELLSLITTATRSDVNGQMGHRDLGASAGGAASTLVPLESRRDHEQFSLDEERERIARDLHDHVISQLFAVGLNIQQLATEMGEDERGPRMLRSAEDLNEAIRQIRTTIFGLHRPPGPGLGTVRRRVMGVVADLTRTLGFPPALRWTGPVDVVVPADLGDDLVAVLRESLTNIARHAEAQRVDISVVCSAHALSVTVTDDGTGLSEGHRRSGLANLQHRALDRGGTFSIGRTCPDRAPHFTGGTELSWGVPLC